MNTLERKLFKPHDTSSRVFSLRANCHIKVSRETFGCLSYSFIFINGVQNQLNCKSSRLKTEIPMIVLKSGGKLISLKLYMKELLKKPHCLLCMY